MIIYFIDPPWEIVVGQLPDSSLHDFRVSVFSKNIPTSSHEGPWIELITEQCFNVNVFALLMWPLGHETAIKEAYIHTQTYKWGADFMQTGLRNHCQQTEDDDTNTLWWN